jgi:hypothetical protein
MLIIGCKISWEETIWEHHHKDSSTPLKCQILGFQSGEDLSYDLLPSFEE